MEVIIRYDAPGSVLGLDAGSLDYLGVEEEEVAITTNLTNLTNGQMTHYDSLSDVGEIRVYQRADFQSGSRVLKKVF